MSVDVYVCACVSVGLYVLMCLCIFFCVHVCVGACVCVLCVCVCVCLLAEQSNNTAACRFNGIMRNHAGAVDNSPNQAPLWGAGIIRAAKLSHTLPAREVPSHRRVATPNIELLFIIITTGMGSSNSAKKEQTNGG